jgi:predicted permease
MLTSYILPLLAVVALCAFWAIFQTWLFKHDPDAERRSQSCGGCSGQGNCSNAGSCSRSRTA